MERVVLRAYPQTTSCLRPAVPDGACVGLHRRTTEGTAASPVLAASLLARARGNRASLGIGSMRKILFRISAFE